MLKSPENFFSQNSKDQVEIEKLKKEKREKFRVFQQRIFDSNYEKYGKRPELWKEAEKFYGSRRCYSFNKIAENFFSYHTIISKDGFQAEYKHSEACLWLLWELVKDKTDKTTEDVTKSIDFLKPFESWIQLSEMKLAKGIKLAEVYGASYARLMALLGGEGTYWIKEKAGIIKPYEKEKYKIPKEYSEKVKNPNYLKFPIDHITSFIHFHGNETSINTENEYCHEGNFKKVFKDKYDIFMAVNCGEWTDRPHNLAKNICKKEEHRYVSDEESSAFYNLYPTKE